MTETTAAAPETAPDRKELLAEAFSALENAQPAPDPVPRTETGQFAPKKVAEAPPDETPDEPLWSRAPASWKREYHEPWATLDPKVKEYVWQREEEMRAGVEPLKTKAQIADAFNKAVEPYMETIQGLGIDPIKAVTGLMEADQKLRKLPLAEKRAYLAQLAASYGVSLGDVDPARVQAPDPQVYELQQKIVSLEGRLNGWTQAQQDAADQQLLSEINEFAPRAELFEDAKPVMIQLLQSGLATGLEDAYQKAIRLDPILYDKAEQSLQADAEAKKRAQADKAAKAAKAAAVSVRSSTPGAPAPTKAPDRRSLLEEQFSGLSERF